MASLEEEICQDVEPGCKFNERSMSRLMNYVEQQQVKTRMDSLKKGCVYLFVKSGLPRKVRLTHQYNHLNTRVYNEKGTIRALCGILLKTRKGQ